MELVKEIDFEIEGICDLLMDRWVDGEQPKTKDGYIKNAEKKVYADEEGTLVIPAKCLKASIRDAASELVGIKKGKAMRQIIRAALFVTKDLNLGKKNHDGIREDVVTRAGSGGKVTRVITYRPCVKDWSAKGRISYVREGNLTPEFIKQALELAGFKYGVMSYRPEFGRFVVKKFTAK
jgi:hypothetical protein